VVWDLDLDTLLVKDVAKDPGLGELTPRDLRHTRASRVYVKTRNINTVQSLRGDQREDRARLRSAGTGPGDTGPHPGGRGMSSGGISGGSSVGVGSSSSRWTDPAVSSMLPTRGDSR